MRSFTKSVAGVLGGASRAAKTFPATFSCAVAFAVIVLLRIQFNWPDEEPYDFIFTCAQWSLALGALVGMAAVALSQTYLHTKYSDTVSNLLAVVAAAVTFIVLYIAGKAQYDGISGISALRVGAVMFVSLVVFVIAAGRTSEETNFTSAMFMTHKSFFIALLYGLVALGGASGVARAVQGLIYPDMSVKVYEYIITLSALLAFLLFVGYFPVLRGGADPERRTKAQHEPRFIEILLSYILAPIMLALTVVLLIWAVMNLFGVTKSSFEQLAAISAAYTIGGLWLHAMTSRDENASAKLYRAVYPAAALVILAFEAWAVAIRLLAHGLQTIEYVFILIWLLAAAGCAILLTWRGDKRPAAHRNIAWVACVLAIIAVLPGVGGIDMPVAAQTARLKSLLKHEGMLSDNTLTPASVEPDEATRASITDAVQFLAYSGGSLPSWLGQNYAQNDVFREKFGFDMLWLNENGELSEPIRTQEIYLSPSDSVIDISGYSLAVSLSDMAKSQVGATFATARGSYTVTWVTAEDGMPTLEIWFKDTMVHQQSFDDYISGIFEKNPLGTGNIEVPRKEMALAFESDEFSALLTLSSVSVSENTSGERSVWITPDQLFIREK